MTAIGIGLGPPSAGLAADPGSIGREIAIAAHWADGAEFERSPSDLIAHGRSLFTANWTSQEGGGRPLTKGTGATLADLDHPLVFPRNFNRISSPDANSCAGCHNSPFGIPGGNGDVVANVFVLAQRFDFARLGETDGRPTVASADERGAPVTQETIGNSRATLGMFGAGYLEMAARQITAELQRLRDALPPGDAVELLAKGISFGELTRRADGSWDASGVQGLPAPSLETAGPTDPPSLLIRPFHQAGNVVSLRQFTVNAFNHHHGIQAVERFGADTDPDGDGFANELTRADVTAATVFQATMAVPGRLIPNDPEIESAVLVGEERFVAVGCAECHKPLLPLTPGGWIYTEPSPYNTPGTARPDERGVVSIDLTSADLPTPRLSPASDGVLYVPAFTDLRLHNITSGPDDPNREPLDMNQPAGSDGFFAGNGRFLTRKLWGAANKPNYFHHGKYTTMREAVLAHAGEALAARRAFEQLSESERDFVIEFLKTLQVLPPGAPHLIVDEGGQAKTWPPSRLLQVALEGGEVIVHWQGDTGIYPVQPARQLQRCTDLNTGLWEDVGEPTRDDSLVDHTNVGAAFYRLREVAP